MKKIVPVLFCFLLAVHLFPAEGKGKLTLALGLEYQYKSDQYFKEVYHNGAVNYTVDVGYWISENFALGAKLSYLSKKGKTLLFESETRLKQMPVVAYLKAGTEIGKRLTGYISLGMGFLFFEEESYIGKIEESHFGLEIEGGVEYPLVKKLFLYCAARYQWFRMTFPELDETQQLGGMGIRLGLGVRF